MALTQARVQQQKAEMALTIAMLGPRRGGRRGPGPHHCRRGGRGAGQAQRDLHTVRAPIDGILDKITCRLGQTLTVGTPIGEIVDSRRLYALVWLPMCDARLVRVGQAAQVSSGDLPASRKVPAGQANRGIDFLPARWPMSARRSIRRPGTFPSACS